MEALKPIPHPVKFTEFPPIEGREYALNERSRYDKLLVGAAEAVRDAHDLAYKDPKTGLMNERALDEELPYILKFAEENDVPIAALAVDVMGLKRANDNDGHLMGDRLLKSVSFAFEDSVREGDRLYRIGGDEFMVLLVGYEPEDGESEADFNARNINRIKETFTKNAHEIGIPDERKVGLSIGLAMFEKGDDANSLIKRADDAEKIDHESVYKALKETGLKFEDRRTEV